ncbi:unnamed protein product [Ceratitis capitata]|uniref:(Mediterranean fruit fly) hypothetical protein n=1 Tax=Ceratitis capitata TaxID=7213 RepID=A0A811VIT3_CERCA|nr:unnamed protein product [Ceratitis capitata]
MIGSQRRNGVKIIRNKYLSYCCCKFSLPLLHIPLTFRALLIHKKSFNLYDINAIIYAHNHQFKLNTTTSDVLQQMTETPIPLQRIHQH